MQTKLGVVNLVGMALLAGAAFAGTTRGGEPEFVPTGKGWGEHHAQGQSNRAGKPGGGKTNGISYHGGPVMTSSAGTDAYYIWYGDWSGNTGAQTLLTTMINGIGGSSYFNINTTYYDAAAKKVVNDVNYLGSVSCSAFLGTNLSDSQIFQVVQAAIAGNASCSGTLAKNANAVYFVLTAANVDAASGFCNQYCGWHTHGTYSGSDIKYSFVGNPETQCPASCSAVTASTAPNSNLAADSMASIIAHELEEAVSDPDLNAWYDTRGYENADKCAWTFGTVTTTGGRVSNMSFGGKNWYIQRNWVNASGGYCAQSY
jgi:hypothetical protein